MSKFIDLKNQKFGRLTVIEKAKTDNGRVYWLCKCECGNIKEITGNNLKRGKVKSCGCLNKEVTSKRFLQDLVGQRFGKLTVIKRAEDYKNNNGGTITQWLCKCDCGNHVVVRGSRLKNGEKTSCGCLNKIQVGQKFGNFTILGISYKKGRKQYYLCKCDCGNEVVMRSDQLKSRKNNYCKQCNGNHHKSKEKIYRVWASMKQRCTNENERHYKYYGGRGISVCPEWLNDFMSFYTWSVNNGYADGLTIDRIDVNGDYCPENCRWVDTVVQANNTRRNRYIKYKGEVHTLTEWSRILNLSSGLLNNRLNNYGWTVDRAFTTPPIRHNKHKGDIS